MEVKEPTKRCPRCTRHLPPTEFYVYRRTGGLQSYCKACSKKSSMEHVKSEEAKQRHREWERAWWQTQQGKACHARSSKAHALRHPTKMTARQAINHQVRVGKVIRPDYCKRCGIANTPIANGRSSIQAHHRDYSKPLEVEWLCPECHKRADKEMANV